MVRCDSVAEITKKQCTMMTTVALNACICTVNIYFYLPKYMNHRIHVIINFPTHRLALQW